MIIHQPYTGRTLLPSAKSDLAKRVALYSHPLLNLRRHLRSQFLGAKRGVIE